MNPPLRTPQDRDALIADYDRVVAARAARHAAERERDEKLAEERRFDRERAKAEKKLRK